MNKFGKYSCLFLLLLHAAILNGCSGVPKAPPLPSASATYEAIDDQGTVVKMRAKPQRVITTHFHLDTMVLGIVPPQRMAAISQTAFDPNVSYMVQEAEPIQQRMQEISLEKVVSLQPDLIIARETTGAEKVQSFREMGIPVFVVKAANSVDEVKDNIHSLAQVLGEPTSGEKIIEKMDRQLEQIDYGIKTYKLVPKSCVLVSKMNHTYGGKGCMFDDMCHYANVKNAVAEIGVQNGQIISKEVMVKANPDFFLLSQSWELKHGNSSSYKDEFLDDPAFRFLKAIQTKQAVYFLDKYLYASHQNCVWAIMKIANAAYGDLFDLKEESFIKGY